MYLPDELEREKQQKIYKRELIEDGTLFKRQLTVWRADLNLKQPGWEPQPLKGRVPSYRSHYAYCFDPSLGRFFMHGGLSMNKELKMVSFGDLYTFERERFEVKRLFTMEAPSPRDSHTMVKIGDRLILFGGKSSPENLILRELWMINC